MLKTPKCSVLECQNELKSFSEVSKGICEHCINLLTDREHFAGVCWNCGTIIGLYEIPRRLERYLTEKYLFAKECQACKSTAGTYLDWITIKKYVGDHHWAIGDNGKLIKVNTPMDTSSNKEYSTGVNAQEKLFEQQTEHSDDQQSS